MSHLRHDTTVTCSTSALGHLCPVVFLARTQHVGVRLTWQIHSRALR